jgi:hypothetical protein
MPCWQTRNITFDPRAADSDLLLAALKALGYEAAKDPDGRLIFWTPNGVGQVFQDRISVDEADAEAGLVTRVKQEYGRQVLKQVSQRFGWRLQGQGTSFTLQKRGL